MDYKEKGKSANAATAALVAATGSGGPAFFKAGAETSAHCYIVLTGLPTEGGINNLLEGKKNQQFLRQLTHCAQKSRYGAALIGGVFPGNEYAANSVSSAVLHCGQGDVPGRSIYTAKVPCEVDQLLGLVRAVGINKCISEYVEGGDINAAFTQNGSYNETDVQAALKGPSPS